MRLTEAIAHVCRSARFARHIPAARIARRVELDVRRRMRDRWPGIAGVLSEALPSRVAQPPLPLFAPRAGGLADSPDGLRLTFQGTTATYGAAGIEWPDASQETARQLWCMSLHYMEYLEAVSDERLAQLLTSWIVACPMRRPGAWRASWNSYAVSLRVVVWLQQLAARSGRLPDGLVPVAEASAVEQVRFLAANLETDLGGNHLIKNIKALIWAGAYLAGEEAATWRRTGLALLETELDRQVLADGVHTERSPSYHAQVLADLVECRHALGGDPFGGRLDRALERMGQALADLTHPDGLPALFNDAGLSMAYAPGTCLAAVAQVTKRRLQPSAVFAYPVAGYYGMRTSEAYLVADCGRIAPDDLPAHGHGDVLSFEWSVGGRRIVVDQGVYEYVAGERRRMSRAAVSHNTLSLAGVDQAEHYGAFRCGRRPRPTVRAWQPRHDGFILEGCHDGFAHVLGRPVHVRRFEAEADRIVIHDRLEGRTGRTATIGLLLHPDVTVTMGNAGARLVSGDVVVDVEGSSPMRLQAAVWWPDLGVELATRRLIMELPQQRPHATTRLVVRSAGPTARHETSEAGAA